MMVFCLGCQINTSKKNITQEKKRIDFSTEVINCDTIYPNKNYEIQLLKVDTGYYNDETKNYIFNLIEKNSITEIFSDSIISQYGNIEFEDFNNDDIKDILIEYDIKGSNLTYTLFLIDTLNNKLTKVVGFEEISNPKFNKEYNIIENLVSSGRNWTSFYKIKNDSIVDLGYKIYWGQDENGNPKNPEKEYEEILKKIRK